MPMQRDNFYYLFFALLVLLLGTPLALDLKVVSTELARLLGFGAVLAIGIWSFQRSRVVFTVGMILAAVAIVVSIVSERSGSVAFGIAAMVLYIAFLVLAILESLRQVALTNDVSANRLTGAVCVYLMLGLIWAVAYDLLHTLQPSAFNVSMEGVAAPDMTYWTYYSFVTLTTLGYGDVLPISATARALAYAEAVFGQLYVAILVAGLVSAYISARQQSAAAPD